MISTYKDIRNSLISKLLSGSFIFDEIALEIFRFQFEFNPDYREYCELIEVLDKRQVDSVSQIPFLPITFFKEKKIKTGLWKEIGYFQSSGTTGQVRSHHYFRDLSLYNHFCVQSFEQKFGILDHHTRIIALLPGYIDNPHSSLIYMINKFGERCDSVHFLLDDFEQANRLLLDAKQSQKKVLFFGLSQALLDFSMVFPQDLSQHLIIETGGSKGKGPDLLKQELHQALSSNFQTTIYSEYGMTELFSQAYTSGGMDFISSSTMSVMMTDTTDPLSFIGKNNTGIVNIIDLLNIDTCSFIQTQDLGKKKTDNSFEIIGRMSFSENRGCSLLY